ncbi:hypothetical protein CRUP_037398 [Coryphaenoides rupestris]|nr:hypothetical protein CRUP_037398 [Coryphaenoides rupestris]
MGYLKQIDVDNFKSWRGTKTLGPFKRFNCIIGTNGSGKSNIMDALGFVMGERVGALRVGRLRDLIHGAHTGRPEARTAAVRLVLTAMPLPGNSSEYSVNGVSVSLAKYKKDLETIGVLTKARNCLVFQGAAESIAMETAKERCKLFERISQSDEFAAEYERQREALHKAKEDTQFHYYRKKTATAERKQVSREKQEARRGVPGLGRLQLLLFRLFHNQQDISALVSRLEERGREVAEQKSGLAEGEAATRALKKEHGRLTREQLGLEKEIRAEEQKLAQAQSKYIKTKVNTSHCVKKAEEARAALRKVQRLRAKREAEVADIRQEMAELGAACCCCVQLEQYKELKERARKKAAVLCQRADRRQLEVTGDRDKIALDHSKSKRVEKYGQQERSLTEALVHSRQRSQEVEQELGQVLEELGNARLDHQESWREQQRKETLQNMRRMYPNDVVRRRRLGYPNIAEEEEARVPQRCGEEEEEVARYGRLVDLCSPIHRKYQLAVTKVFGHYLNAIVVSTQTVACSCIQYLRQERAEAETFLPVNYLIAGPLNERLRELREAKMVVDVVQCNSEAMPALKKVLQFVCGNAVVCESIQDARRLAFGGPQRLKSGVISGGSSYLRTKARCWEDQDLRKLTEQKDQLTAELRVSSLAASDNDAKCQQQRGCDWSTVLSLTCPRGLVKTRAKESELKDVQVQAQGVQTRLKYTDKDLQTLVSKDIPNCQAPYWFYWALLGEGTEHKAGAPPQEISNLESELLNLEADVQMQQKSVEVKEVEMKNIRDRMDQLEYEVEQGEQQQRKLHQLEGTIDKEEVTIAQQTEEEGELLGVVEQGQNQILDLKDLLQAKTLQISEAKARLDQETKRLQEANRYDRSWSGSKRALVTLEMSLEQLPALAKHNLLSVSESESAVVTADIYEREAQLYVLRTTSAPNLKALEKMRGEEERYHENIEEPYLGGINYNCVAPGKRFMSMDNLFRPAPFFILDEVDAALDNTNIGKAGGVPGGVPGGVTSFIREESKEGMQFIIISLKKEFYSRADALLGVYPQFNGCMASGSLLLDLQPYPMHQEDPDE